MSKELTFKQLIDYFQARITRIENDARKFMPGDVPQHPLLVVFLGEDTQASFVSIASHLGELWPQCKGHIPYLRASMSGDGVTLQQLSLDDNGQVVTCDITIDQLAALYDELRSEDGLYNSMTIRHIYYIIDTTAIDTIQEFDMQSGLITYIKEEMGIQEFEIRDSLIVLLRGESKKRAVSDSIRSRLSSFHEETRLIDCDSVFLLSNERNDGVLLRSWNTCYRIVVLYIALSNSSDDAANNLLFQHRVYNASYSIVSKPTYSIAQVVMDEYLRELKRRQQPVNYDVLQTEGIDTRLGITQEGTFAVIDSDAEKVIQKIVPTEEQLCVFPRSSCSEYDIARMSFEQFDQLTFGALSTYLDKRRKELLSVDENQRLKWAEAYGEMLRENFSNDELVYLGNNIAGVRAHLESRRVRVNTYGVIDGAIHKLKASLATDPNIVDLFVDQTQIEANRVEAFQNIWEKLLASLVAVKKISDAEIVDYYKNKAKYYLDENGAENFFKLTNADEMEAYFHNAIDSIINKNKIFYAPFESEIMQRLQATEEGADAYGWILQQLTEDNLHTYLRVNFNHGSPVVKAVFIEGESELKDRLRMAMKNTKFYHTGSNRSAEVLHVYVVNSGNLNK